MAGMHEKNRKDLADMITEQVPSRDVDDTAGSRKDYTRYLSPDLLKHMVLDFKQMQAFVQEPLVMARRWGLVLGCHRQTLFGRHFRRLHGQCRPQ
jgi:hypothetical protein